MTLVKQFDKPMKYEICEYSKGISKKWHEAKDPYYGWDMGLRTLKVGSTTQDLGTNSKVESRTQDPRP